MKSPIISPKGRRQRQMLLALPLLLVPFLTLFFWALGGGKGTTVQAAVQQKGFNASLPDAKLKDEGNLNKMSYYDRAAGDSARLKQQMRSDPYYKGQLKTDTSHFPVSALSGKLSGSAVNGSPAVNEAKVYQKLALLQAEVGKPELPETPKMLETDHHPELPLKSAQPVPADPELTQMNGLLEKILDIQHPERLKPVNQQQPAATESKQFNAILAIIDGTQKVTQGTVVRLKLIDSVMLDGQLFQKGQLLYGSGTLSNQRFTLNIKSIHIGSVFYPVDLTVFDQVDGLEGVCVPEAITGDALRDGANNGVQGMEIMSLDQSMSAQLAGAGINTAKGIFSKKVKRVKGKLKNGHPLLLRINKTN
ncbi:conjugative transposon protein TraM [Mucilaginibacter sp. McL0603]|uniref:conjugative transposon protein TraM n=1 Tax=Mucilaginibacter sp. McL0603 TaxID=3415670 RepID=UPI003CE9D32A